MLLRTPDIVNEMVTAVFDSPFMIKAHENKKCTLFTDKVQDKKVTESIASRTSTYGNDHTWIEGRADYGSVASVSGF